MILAFRLAWDFLSPHMFGRRLSTSANRSMSVTAPRDLPQLSRDCPKGGSLLYVEGFDRAEFGGHVWAAGGRSWTVMPCVRTTSRHPRMAPSPPRPIPGIRRSS